MEILGFLLGVFFFVLLEAFFAGSEIALVSVDKGRVMNLYRRTKQEFLRDFYENPEEYVTLTMLGYTFSIVFASTFYTLAVIKLSDYLTFIRGFEVIFSASLVVFTLLLGELLPKSLFQKHAERLILPSLWVLSKLKTFTKPLLTLARAVSRLITKTLKEKYQERLHREDLIRLLEGTAVREESLRIALRSITMRDLFATEEIRPIKEVVMVEENAGTEQVMELMKESQYRRLPVYRRRVDQIVGYVDLFDLVQSRHARLIRELIRPVHYFSEFTTLDKVFEFFKRSKEQMGVVVDERGNLLGIITWDDLQSYLIGGLSEGKVEEEEDIVEIEKDIWIADGSVEKERVERLLNVKLPEGPYTTLGGFLSFNLRGIPEKGQVVEYEGYRFKVLQRDERRIIKVRIEGHVSE
ncbi:hemolysin family protein [Pampinifervens florentissimum]|uniref:hemolysin family protein n=1 Tax=Pampinifervens florentissimum TaxID=1632019 RepID=UPI0013B49D3A|nr:hemolysin family protein [Hydrogenobacter sp. T-8]QID32787.1 HlyC/CorC family transporter [Hydrogenobacter sp. T-8]